MKRFGIIVMEEARLLWLFISVLSQSSLLSMGVLLGSGVSVTHHQLNIVKLIHPVNLKSNQSSYT